MQYERTIQQKIINIAASYLGEKEKPENGGFINPEFERKMKAQGWNKDEAWCSYFAKLVWMEAYQESEDMKAVLSKTFSPSATLTWSKFERRAGFTVSDKPAEGAIIIFQLGKGWQGHTGIVTGIDNTNNCVITIEGNTNNNGSREGIEVCKKLRRMNKPFEVHGLNILGFVHPPIL